MKPVSKPLAKAASLPLLLMSLYAHSATLFSDNFNDGNANGWTIVKEGSGSPAWTVTNGRYTQNSRVRNFTQSFHIGTYAYYENGFSARNYQLFARLTPVEGDSVGVMFRYTDNGNYYRFSINGYQGFSRLEKKVNGSFRTLAFDGVGPRLGKTYLVRIVASGPNILVYLDGKPLFGAVDTSLTSGTVALFAQNDAAFDDVVVSTPDAIPRLVLSAPVSYFVDTDTTLDVAAIATSAPAGGGVRFTLDNRPSFADFTVPYGGRFFNLSTGDHTLNATTIDRAGHPLPNVLAKDTNVVVGSSGRYFVAMGDSITNGTGDDIGTDNTSDDGRNVSRGFTPILNNLLSAQQGLPVVVMNEGLGGTTAGHSGASGESRISSAKDRQAGSRYWLIQFGTNDASGAVPSGRGLTPGDSGYSGSFKDSMQRIIDSLKQSNKIPLLAKVPFKPHAPSQDQRVQDYNAVIDELVAANGIAVTPPDFYNYFKQHPEQFSDDLHPDGAGYRAMANLWSAAIINSGILNR